MTVLASVGLAAFLTFAQAEPSGAPWKKDLGKPAPPLLAQAWQGTPVSLDAVRGNTVLLAFWNADIPC